MNVLNSSQLKTVSEFSNMVAAAWFTAGTVSPFFSPPEIVAKSVIFVVAGVLMGAGFLAVSIHLTGQTN